MATFQTQVEDMVGTVETSVGSGTSDTTAITSWLTDGVRELINVMPMHLLIQCAAEQTFAPKSVGSEAEILNTGKIFNIRRSDGTIDQPCRLILSHLKGRASDNDEMEYATATDPIYYLENGMINILPSSSSSVGKYSEVQFPAVSYGDSSIGKISLSSVTSNLPSAGTAYTFTSNSHGLSDGDSVTLSNFTEITALNGVVSQIVNTATNTFQLEGVLSDGSTQETTGGNVVKEGGFPDELEYLVVLYAAMKSAERIVMNYLNDEDVELSSSRMNQYNWLVGQYNKGIKVL